MAARVARPSRASRRQRLPPGRTQRHHHARTEEIYIVVAGSGRMEVEGEEREIGPGDAVLIPRERGTGFGPGRQASCGSSACCAPPYSDEDTFFE